MINTLFSIINSVAQVLGYLIMVILLVGIGWKLWYKYMFQPTVSQEAKDMAKELDPNNGVTKQVGEFVFQNILDGVRELERHETIRADPVPLTHFDWSVDSATQEDVEHILRVLQKAGYYTHPLPDVNDWDDGASWSRERAGVWRSEPDWFIVEFDDSGEKLVKERVDLPLASEWRVSN